jgi:hypothetical protein
MRLYTFIVLAVIFLSLSSTSCGGDNKKGTVYESDGGSLRGTWRVEVEVTSSNCPEVSEINYSEVDTVIYTAENTETDYLQLPFECNGDIEKEGNNYTVKLTCSDSISIEGNGTISEDSYHFTCTLTWGESCVANYSIEGTRFELDQPKGL